MIAIAAKIPIMNSAYTMLTLVTSPSIPSVSEAAFVMPSITSAASGTYQIPISHSPPETGRCSVGPIIGERYAQTATTAAMTSSTSTF